MFELPGMEVEKAGQETSSAVEPEVATYFPELLGVHAMLPKMALYLPLSQDTQTLSCFVNPRLHIQVSTSVAPAEPVVELEGHSVHASNAFVL
jgi:hypothetical protein